MVRRFLYFSYGLILLVFLANILLPFFGLSLTLDLISLGFAGLLMIFSFALVIFHDPGLLSRLKISTTGLEAEFRELRNRISEDEIQQVEDTVKSEVQQIEVSDTEPRGVFLTLISEIESKLRLLAEKRVGGSWEYRPVPTMATSLFQNTIIDENTLSLIIDFWGLRNQIVHGKLSLSNENLTDAINIGQIIIDRLQKPYLWALIINPPLGSKGSVVTLTGTGLTKGGYASIYYNEIEESNLLQRIRVSDESNISTELTVPHLSKGNLSIIVLDELSGLRMQTSFEIV